MSNKPTPHEVEIGRLTKKLNKMRDQRDKARKDLEYYKKVISMQPYLAKRYDSYQDRIAEMQRVRGLEDRIKEQAELIKLLQ
jgi:conjugal transfer/entry exclusion protein